MRLASLSLIWLATFVGPAFPEDFTGVYAGVNAGYGFSGKDQSKAGFGLPAPDDPRTSDMPPSARQASEVLRARNLRDRPSPLR
ncbi:MAG: hypothetical protein Q7T93_15765 [Methylobacterium sp.]|jgi:hypothetical protein|uniref:hypothetical protein n=1 Tax=unclassified Methylobacterium TaxID=2615210 RepID=UPI0006FEEC2B|nr:MULTISPECIES: hypothetical protein [unclassified Methylobacterium]KQP09889.1 hypothetical protein ASF28_01530 [Methylobacterium sp. Leaf99]MDO9428273.1 hypothetical protein [Methylobacterium sp.]TXM68510.1 hypothetical protein FV218_18135 [Methylobacterium sp. WL69]